MSDFVESMSRCLEIGSLRQQLLASNIANVDTPGYKTQDINFNQALSDALAGDVLKPKAMPINLQTDRPDGNDVSLERETLAMAETEARFRMAAQVLRAHFHELNTALQGDR